MNLSHKNTALLVFCFSAELETNRKYIFGKEHKKENTAFFKLLLAQTKKLAAQSVADVYWVDEHQQIGVDFSTRFTNAFQKFFDAGYENVVSIGNDCPDLSSEQTLNRKFTAVIDQGYIAAIYVIKLNIIMKSILIAVLQLFVMTLFSQENTYSSRLLDNTGQPIPYAAVYEEGTQNYTTSNENGYFRLTTKSVNFTIQISSIGFETLNVQVVNGRLSDELVLVVSQEQLDEVVVTALGIEKGRRALVSAVSTVDSEKLTMVPQTNLVNSLAGQVAGVQITNGSSFGPEAKIARNTDKDLNALIFIDFR